MDKTWCKAARNYSINVLKWKSKYIPCAIITATKTAGIIIFVIVIFAFIYNNNNNYYYYYSPSLKYKVND